MYYNDQMNNSCIEFMMMMPVRDSWQGYLITAIIEFKYELRALYTQRSVIK